MKKKSITKLILILVMVFVFSACGVSSEGYDDGEVNKTLKGQLMGQVGSYVLFTDDGETVSLDSNNFDLSSFVGDDVSVTGQYSGSTLYVDQVK
jgi:hypothetical protein